MEEENLCCASSNNTASALQQPEQDSGSLITNWYINGEHETIVWGETEMQIKQSHGPDQPNFPQDAGRESPKEAEQWEPIVWPTRPVLCTSASLSFATVQWDMPGSYDETPSLVTDSSLANELACSGVTSADSTPPSFQFEDINAELFMPETEGQDEFDPMFLDVECKGNILEPCDAEDVQAVTTQEKEDTNDLLKSQNEVSLRTDSEEEEELSVTSDSPVDVINTLEDFEGSEDDRDSFVNVKLEEEQEEPDVLLTAQANPAEEQTAANGVETDDKSEEQCELEGEQSGINVSCAEGSQELQTVFFVSYLSDVDVPVGTLQTADAGLTLNSNNLQLEHLEEKQHSGAEEDIELLEQTHEDSTGQTEDPGMCEDVDQHAEREQTDDDKDKTLIEAAEQLQGIESTQERLELTGQVGETSCSEQQECNQTISEEKESSALPEGSESEPLETTKESEQTEAEASHQAEQHSEDSEQLGQSEYLDQSPPPMTELTEPLTQHENVDKPEEAIPGVCFEAEEPEVADQQEQMETQTEQNEQSLQMEDTCQPVVSEQPGQPEKTIESEKTEQELPETEVTQQREEAELKDTDQMDTAKPSDQTDHSGDTEDGDVKTFVANGEQPKPLDTAVPHMNGGDVDREMARLLAERLFNLDDVQRVDVVKHLDKDNNFSHAVGEEYLKFFDFNGQTLDQALRSFLKVVILIGETQERERVLQHFSCRFHQCNPENFSSSGAVLALTCAVMLLNTDLHGQHVGKSMSSSKFVSNLDGMNEGTNFSKDLLKSLYNSIKNEPLEWAVDDDELKSSMLLGEDAVDDAPMRSKANPFLDVPHDKNASVIKEGFLQRKLHADIDGKRTPWGKRGWKTFNAVLRGMVLYLQKNDYRREQLTYEEVVSVHHSLAEQAADYTKKPHVFRLQTADWRVFLFQASSQKEMNSWISRINLVSALHSSPPFPAAVGSQKKFFRPILPASQSAHTMEHQLQSHARMLESFKADLLYLQQNPPEGRKAKTKDLEEHRLRAEYLQHEISRYKTYIEVLEAWAKVAKVAKAGDNMLSPAELLQFEKAVCADTVEEVDGAEGTLKKSISSPSLAVELVPPIVIKVRRNISERRTQRRIIVPRQNKEA